VRGIIAEVDLRQSHILLFFKPQHSIDVNSHPKWAISQFIGRAYHVPKAASWRAGYLLQTATALQIKKKNNRCYSQRPLLLASGLTILFPAPKIKLKKKKVLHFKTSPLNCGFTPSELSDRVINMCTNVSMSCGSFTMASDHQSNALGTAAV